MTIRFAVFAAAVSLAACGGPDIAAEQAEMRAPANVLQKTAQILEVSDPDSIAISDIHLRDLEGGGAQVVEWSAKTAEGDFSCNSDIQMAHPVCDQVQAAGDQPSAVEVAAEQAAAGSAFQNAVNPGALEDVIPPDP